MIDLYYNFPYFFNYQRNTSVKKQVTVPCMSATSWETLSSLYIVSCPCEGDMLLPHFPLPKLYLSFRELSSTTVQLGTHETEHYHAHKHAHTTSRTWQHLCLSQKWKLKGPKRRAANRWRGPRVCNGDVFYGGGGEVGSRKWQRTHTVVWHVFLYHYPCRTCMVVLFA